MKKLFYFFARLKSEKGVTAIIVALLLVVFLGVAALAIDVGYQRMVRNQLQNAADAAALAGAGQLGAIYVGMTLAEQQATLSDENIALVKNAAINTALANKAAGQNVNITFADDDDDLTIGTWNFNTSAFSVPTPLIFPNAVRVKIRRDANVAAGPITTFFGRIFGKNTMEVSAEASAALSYQCTGGKAPFTISDSWFEGDCPTNVLTWEGVSKSEPDSQFTNCIAWRGNTQAVRDIIHCIDPTRTDVCTDSTVGNEIPYSNGVIDNLFDKGDTNFLDLFDKMRVLNDPEKGDADTSNDTWTTEVEITNYRCGQGEGSTATLTGYMTVTIDDVMVDVPDPKPNDPSNVQTVRAITLTPVCEKVQQGRGGCTLGGNIGSVPSLVH